MIPMESVLKCQCGWTRRSLTIAPGRRFKCPACSEINESFSAELTRAPVAKSSAVASSQPVETSAAPSGLPKLNPEASVSAATRHYSVTCPHCHKDIRVAEGTDKTASVQCPFCHRASSLSKAANAAKQQRNLLLQKVAMVTGGGGVFCTGQCPGCEQRLQLSTAESALATYKCSGCLQAFAIADDIREAAKTTKYEKDSRPARKQSRQADIDADPDSDIAELGLDSSIDSQSARKVACAWCEQLIHPEDRFCPYCHKRPRAVGSRTSTAVPRVSEDRSPKQKFRPETGDLRPATVGQRILARLLDWLVRLPAALIMIWAMWDMLVWSLALRPQVLGASPEMNAEIRTKIFAGLASWISFVIVSAFLSFGVGLTDIVLSCHGQSIGKYVLGICVWDVKGQQVAGFVKTYLVRGILHYVMLSIPIFNSGYVIADLVMFFTDKHLRIVDRIADTQVIQNPES